MKSLLEELVSGDYFILRNTEDVNPTRIFCEVNLSTLQNLSTSSFEITLGKLYFCPDGRRVLARNKEVDGRIFSSHGEPYLLVISKTNFPLTRDYNFVSLEKI